MNGKFPLPATWSWSISIFSDFMGASFYKWSIIGVLARLLFKGFHHFYVHIKRKVLAIIKIIVKRAIEPSCQAVSSDKSRSPYLIWLYSGAAVALNNCLSVRLTDWLTARRRQLSQSIVVCRDIISHIHTLKFSK